MIQAELGPDRHGLQEQAVNGAGGDRKGRALLDDPLQVDRSDERHALLELSKSADPVGERERVRSRAWEPGSGAGRPRHRCKKPWMDAESGRPWKACRGVVVSEDFAVQAHVWLVA